MSIQSNINQLIGLTAVATRMSPQIQKMAENRELKKSLSEKEATVRQLGKYDEATGKFKGTKKDFEKIQALGLGEEYTNLLRKGSESGLLNPEEASSSILAFEKKLQPTKGELIKQKAKDIEINKRAKELAMERMRGRGASKIEQKNQFEALRQQLSSDDIFSSVSPEYQEKILKQYSEGGYNGTK